MRTFVFHAVFEPGDGDGIVVSFPDVPEAITQGETKADARAMAEEALGLALLSYPARGLPLPKAKARGQDMVPIAVAPDVAAKLAVLEAFNEAGISKAELARTSRQGRERGPPHSRPPASHQAAGLDGSPAHARQAPRGGRGEGSVIAVGPQK